MFFPQPSMFVGLSPFVVIYCSIWPFFQSSTATKKNYLKSVSCFLLLFNHSLFCISTAFPSIFVSPLYLRSCVCPAVLARVLLKICSIFPGIRLFREVQSAVLWSVTCACFVAQPKLWHGLACAFQEQHIVLTGNKIHNSHTFARAASS